jgi:hypothetical protein
MRDEIEGLKNWLIIVSLIFIGIGVIVSLYLWHLDVVPIEHLNNSPKILTTKEFIELKRQGVNSVIEALKGVATTFGGVAILFNVFYAAKRAKAMDDSAIAANKSADAALDNAKAALKNAKAAQDKQITERFTKAVELLGSPNISIRSGGIYALERIAKDSKKDHWTIMEVLTAFVREKAPLKKEEIQQEQLPKIPTDIQAALTVIGRRKVKRDPNNRRLDLSNTDIRGAKLEEANLQKAILFRANLQNVSLYKADLQEASLYQANFLGAILDDAKLHGAKLRQVQNLQQEQIETALGDSATVLPDNMERPAHWTQAGGETDAIAPV